MCISATTLLPYLPCYYPLHIIYFLHLLSTSDKCTQPCYFPLSNKPTAQKVKMDMKNSLTRSSRIALHRLLFLWCLEPSAVVLLVSRFSL
jgi:hypothetical protein